MLTNANIYAYIWHDWYKLVPFAKQQASIFNLQLQVDASRHEKRITYAELLINSKKCAAYLQGLGIKKGDYISVFSSNRLEFVYLMLGVIGSGAVLTPCKDFQLESIVCMK